MPPSAPQVPARGLLNNFEVRLLLRALVEEQDIPLRRLLRGLGLPRELLDRPGLRLTLAQEMALYTRCASLNRDPMLGFRVGARLPVANYGILGYAMLGAETVGEALGLLADFAPLVSWASRNDLSIETIGGVECRCLTLYPSAAEPEASQLEIDSTVASLRSVLDELAGERLPLQCVELRRGHEGLDFDLLQQQFECPISFSAERNMLALSSDVASLQLPHPQPEYSELFRDMCRQTMASLLEDQGMLDTLRGLIRDAPGKPPGLEEASAHFGLSSRSLRRYLTSMGFTYRSLLDEERFALARHYLSSTDLTVEAVAKRLGYSDARSFRTAFRRWAQCTPQQFRNA